MMSEEIAESNALLTSTEIRNPSRSTFFTDFFPFFFSTLTAKLVHYIIQQCHFVFETNLILRFCYYTKLTLILQVMAEFPGTRNMVI